MKKNINISNINNKKNKQNKHNLPDKSNSHRKIKTKFPSSQKPTHAQSSTTPLPLFKFIIHHLHLTLNIHI